ncbi:hypothetical protein [Salmonella enterica]|nr:hypothetical protein [Salmonella enterica]
MMQNVSVTIVYLLVVVLVWLVYKLVDRYDWRADTMRRVSAS